VLKGAGVIKDGLPPGAVEPMIAGIVAAAISSYTAIAAVLAYVRRRSCDVFVGYHLLAATIVLLIATGAESASL
jgi:undecaprenyl-diphosphatase